MHRKIRQIEIGIFVFTLCLGFSRFTQAGEPRNSCARLSTKQFKFERSKLQSQDKKGAHRSPERST